MASPTFVAGSATTWGDNTTGTSSTQAYTAGAGSNRIILVWASTNGGGTPTSATYGGVAMTTGTDFAETNYFCRYFYMLESSILGGSNNIVVNYPSGDRHGFIAVTYKDADQTTPLDGVTPVNGSGAGATTASLTVTTVTDGSKIVYMGVTAPGASTFLGASGGTLRGSYQFSTAVEWVALSDEDVVTAGSASTGISWTTAAAFEGNMIALRYSPASGPANLKSYNTNLKANIKSVNTNLFANVKSLNTNI